MENIKGYFPVPKTVQVIDGDGKQIDIIIKPLVWDEFWSLIDVITEVIIHILSDENNKINLNNLQINDLPKLLPILKQIKTILLKSINKDDNWIGKKATIPVIMFLITEFITVNGIESITANFERAKALLTTKLKKK